MQKLVKEYLSEWKKQQKKRRRIGIAAMILIVMVVSCVIGSLTQYGVALTGDPKCGMEEHQHNDSCYTSVLTCRQEESEGHQHNDSCYTTITELTCGQEEGEEHQHDDSCYTETSELTCGQEESDGHTHTDECYTEEFTCDMEEHTHTDECYTDADVEDASVWNLQYENVEWTGSWGENLVTAARIQIGYKESTDNYIAAEDGSHKGYTRYGQFAKLMYDAYANDENIVYTDWDAAFTDFCLFYAGLKETGIFPDEIDAAKWCEEFIRKNEQSEDSKKYLAGLKEAGDDTPAAGDIVFFEREKKTEDGIIEKETRMGIVSSYNKENNQIRVIEGNYQDQVKENDYSVKDGSIARYVKTTEIEKLYKGVDEKEEETESTNKDNQLEEPEIKDTEEKTSESNKLNQKKNIRELENESAVNAIGEIQEEENNGSEIPSYAASIPIKGSQNGKMVLELLYSDDKSNNDKKEEVQYPHVTLGGSFSLYAKDIEGDLDMKNLKITLHFPKEYINPETIEVEPFTDPAHDISEVREVNNYYEIDITFPEYQQTGQTAYPFYMKFYGGIVPEDYELKVFATLSDGDEMTNNTAENIYKPKYDKPKIVKYVNTNQFDSMQEDYTRVAASVGEDGVVEDKGYVSFWYKIGGDKWYFREYDQTVLTDTLPTYQKCVRDEKGKLVYEEDEVTPKTEEATAVFDPALNPGWVLSENDKKVSCTLTTDKSCTTVKKDDHHWVAANDLEDQINATELKLKFPDCLIDEKANDNFLKKDLLNKIEADFHPHDPSKEEENKGDDHAEDTLIFTLTNQPVGAGFAKYNSSNIVMDTQTVREGLYKWGIVFSNDESTKPLTDIKLTDYELDERLKIHTLRLEVKGWDPEAEDRVGYIEAETYNGEKNRYEASQFGDVKYEGSFGYFQELVLDSNKEYKGFTVHMKNGFELKINEKIHIGVYTTFREPNKRHYIISKIKDDPRNTYHNGAQVDYKLDDTFYNIVSGNQFSMINTSENIHIEKSILYGDKVSLGDENKYWDIRIKGSLMDGKDYSDMRIVELLPEAFTLPTNANEEREVRFGKNGDCVKRSDIIDNYKNTGRTAVILWLDVEKVRKILDAPLTDKNGNTIDYVSMTLITNVLKDARVGTYENEVWLLSEDFESITTQPSRPDAYDVDDDGDTEEQIRYASAQCIVNSPKGVYAEKLIAPAGSNTWRKTDLYLGVGDEFRYKLCVINMAEQDHRGLLVYDVLPTIGDKNISNSGERGSEYTVKLSDWIKPPKGYEVYYTTSDQVYKESMRDVLGNQSDINPDPKVEWISGDDIEDQIREQITAFKIVAVNDEVVISSKGRAEFEIPVKVTDVLDQPSYNTLEQKESANRPSGTATYLVSTNSFGYRVSTFSGSSNLESNYVRAQIPFAGFVIQKVDSNDKDIKLANTEFTLERKRDENKETTKLATGLILSENNANTLFVNEEDILSEDGENSLLPEPEWETIDSKTSDTNGKISFKNLTEGTYRLTEVKAPNGYHLDNTPYMIEIRLDRITMEYSYIVTRDGVSVNFEGKGNSGDPFKITNRLDYELPSTGGIGIYWYMFGGMLLILAAALMAYRNKCKEVLRS